MEIGISLNTDSDGFTTQECPACRDRFKATIGEGSSEPLAWCPYCSHYGTDCWFTPEQARHIEDVASAAALQHTQDELKKMVRKLNSAGGMLRMSVPASNSIRTASEAPAEPDNDWPIITFACCGERIKHDGSAETLFCVICGTPHELREVSE